MEALQLVPRFTLKDQDGNLFSIEDYIGKNKLVIFFYPKDESPVCTKEACAFRDNFEVFQQAGAMVIGISSDSVESHKAFQQHHHLPYTLLSDPDNKVLKQFGIKNVLFLTGRETFVVDLHGNIAFQFRSMLNGKAHIAKTLEFLKNNQ
jgi:thioredoxin-dependent peroxiredoxin